MSIPIGQLKGMSDDLAAKLKGQGIFNSDQFLDKVRTSAGRKQLATALGVEPSVLLELANRADLARIKGVAGVYSDLLENAGVDTVKELARRDPENLLKKMVATATGRRPPAVSQVAGWIEQAKVLPKLIEY